jgi:gluconate 5-dehydrogenase
LELAGTSVVADVTDWDSIAHAVQETFKAVPAIDVLINNAGTTWKAAPEELPLAGWQKVIDVNLTGVFLCSREVGRVMIEAGGGKIVNIASVMASRGAPAKEVDAIAYNTSKASTTIQLLLPAGFHVPVTLMVIVWVPAERPLAV